MKISSRVRGTSSRTAGERAESFAVISAFSPFATTVEILPSFLKLSTSTPAFSMAERSSSPSGKAICTFSKPSLTSSISLAKMTSPLCRSIALSQSSPISVMLWEDTTRVAPRSKISSTIIVRISFRMAGSRPSKASSRRIYFVRQASAAATIACLFMPFENCDSGFFRGRSSFEIRSSNTLSSKVG